MSELIGTTLAVPALSECFWTEEQLQQHLHISFRINKVLISIYTFCLLASFFFAVLSCPVLSYYLIIFSHSKYSDLTPIIQLAAAGLEGSYKDILRMRHMLL